MSFEEQIETFFGQTPRIGPGAFIAPHAFVVGDVEIGENASIWPGSSIRGDIASIRIGANSNIQDGSVVHVADHLPTVIGDWVTVGHNATVHACTIEDEVLIGMGAVVLDGAVIGTQSIIGASATVTPRTVIPPGSLVLGSPGRVTKVLSLDDRAGIRKWAERYVTVSRAYLAKQAL